MILKKYGFVNIESYAIILLYIMKAIIQNVHLKNESIMDTQLLKNCSWWKSLGCTRCLKRWSTVCSFEKFEMRYNLLKPRDSMITIKDSELTCCGWGSVNVFWNRFVLTFSTMSVVICCDIFVKIFFKMWVGEDDTVVYTDSSMHHGLRSG